MCEQIDTENPGIESWIHMAVQFSIYIQEKKKNTDIKSQLILTQGSLMHMVCLVYCYRLADLAAAGQAEGGEEGSSPFITFFRRPASAFT